MALGKNIVGGQIKLESYFVTSLTENLLNKQNIIINDNIKFRCEQGISAKEILSKLSAGEELMVSYGAFYENRGWISKKGDYIEVFNNGEAKVDEKRTAEAWKY